MKSTSTGALSFVMHVWCGIVRNRSRRSTRTGLSMPGMTTTIPGPFSAWAFPSRKFTIRSYSLTTLRLAKSRIRMMITKMNAPTAASTRSAPCRAVTEPRSRRLTNTPIPLPRGRKLAPRFKDIVGLPQPDLCPDCNLYPACAGSVACVPGGPTPGRLARLRGSRYPRRLADAPRSDRLPAGVRGTRAVRADAHRHRVRDRIEGRRPHSRRLSCDHLPRGLACVHQRQARAESGESAHLRGVLQGRFPRGRRAGIRRVPVRERVRPPSGVLAERDPGLESLDGRSDPAGAHDHGPEGGGGGPRRVEAHLPGDAGRRHPLDGPGPRARRYGPTARAHAVPRRGPEARVETGGRPPYAASARPRRRRSHGPRRGADVEVPTGHEHPSERRPARGRAQDRQSVLARERARRQSGPRDCAPDPVPSSREADDSARFEVRGRCRLRDVWRSREGIRER